MLTFNKQAKFTDTLNSTPQDNSNSSFNKKKIKIVVATRQYRAGIIDHRGYGDIASGVKALEYLMKIYPSAKIDLVVEHHAYEHKEFSKIKTIKLNCS